MNEPTPTHTVEESMIWRNGRNNGIREERERIIKLLEARILTKPQPTDLIGSVSHAGHNQLLRNCIALIKGENK
jgi:hypothetical protein